MRKITCGWVVVLVAVGLASIPDLAAANENEQSGASVDVSIGGEGGATDGDGALAGNRPTHGPYNLHLAIGAAFALGDDLETHDPKYDEAGGEGSLGIDFVLIEPLALSILGGFDGFNVGPKDGLRSIFVGGGFRLRLLADRNGAAFDDGTAAGEMWLDAHFAYYTYDYEDHGGYNIGLGYELALWDGVNLGPYVRFHHTPIGDGLNFAMLAAGVTISFGGKFEPDDIDGDGIWDDKDECPRDPEDKDGFEDEDGCPDNDNDGDGILDADDECPDEAGVESNAGCPDDDLDRDGIPNDVDKCPNEAEDFDGFEDEDGCPDEDNDGDGIPDADDQCPNEAEDLDGFEDEDGCPDEDNDGDGIPDADDQCPNEPETFNGEDDEDGCPDLVRVVGQQIKILQKVYFATNKSKILEKSFPVLDEVAKIIQLKEKIRVRVEGHTDDRGRDKKNMKLSQARADSVVAYLVEKGVAEDRLISEGKGENEPIADNDTAEGQARNRRVEFHIISKAEDEQPSDEGEQAAEQPSDEQEAPAEDPYGEE